MTVSKFCEKCGKMMWDVQPCKRFCDTCIKEKARQKAKLNYEKKKAKYRLHATEKMRKYFLWCLQNRLLERGGNRRGGIRMTILANIIGGAALSALFVVFYALGVSAGREATQQREEDISMEHTHGGEK